MSATNNSKYAIIYKPRRIMTITLDYDKVLEILRKAKKEYK